MYTCNISLSTDANGGKNGKVEMAALGFWSLSSYGVWQWTVYPPRKHHVWGPPATIRKWFRYPRLHGSLVPTTGEANSIRKVTYTTLMERACGPFFFLNAGCFALIFYTWNLNIDLTFILLNLYFFKPWCFYRKYLEQVERSFGSVSSGWPEEPHSHSQISPPVIAWLFRVEMTKGLVIW